MAYLKQTLIVLIFAIIVLPQTASAIDCAQCLDASADAFAPEAKDAATTEFLNSNHNPACSGSGSLETSPCPNNGAYQCAVLDSKVNTYSLFGRYDISVVYRACVIIPEKMLTSSCLATLQERAVYEQLLNVELPSSVISIEPPSRDCYCTRRQGCLEIYTPYPENSTAISSLLAPKECRSSEINISGSCVAWWVFLLLSLTVVMLLLVVLAVMLCCRYRCCLHDDDALLSSGALSIFESPSRYSKDSSRNNSVTNLIAQSHSNQPLDTSKGELVAIAEQNRRSYGTRQRLGDPVNRDYDWGRPRDEQQHRDHSNNNNNTNFPPPTTPQHAMYFPTNRNVRL